MKQSGRTLLPRIEQPFTLEKLLAGSLSYNKTLIAAAAGDSRPVREIFETKKKNENGVLIAVGPEGGFTSDELDQAREYNAVLVSLGQRRLRSETAGLVLLTQVLSYSDELS